MVKKSAVCLLIFLLLLIGAVFLEQSLEESPEIKGKSRVMSNGGDVFAPREYVKIVPVK